jgi:hypothetical protein
MKEAKKAIHWYKWKSEMRGRRREARRWMAEQVAEPGAVRLARTDELIARDPALYATVIALTFENIDKDRGFTAAERRIRAKQRIANLPRDPQLSSRERNEAARITRKT